MAYADFRHKMPLRVRWAEVDRQGVVFNAHYLLYADVCITEYWRALGTPYPDAFLKEGADLYARKATVEYQAAALYDDLLQICGRVARLGRTSVTCSIEIYRSDQLTAMIAAVELVYVNVDPASRAPQPVAAALRARIRDFEVVAPADAG